MPKKPNFSLNLDGCRFGDSPPSFHHRHTTTPQNNDQSENKNNEIRPANHVNQSYNPNIHNLQFSPPPSQHSNNERKQKNRQQNCFHPMDMMNQIASPLGTTYRAEGLSIGRDFLRFQGSTLSSSFCLDDLIVDECVGRGACSMVLKAKRRKEQVECDHEMGGMNNATHPKTPTPSQQKMQQKQNQKEKTRSNCNGKEEYYALKIFTMRDVEKRNMLLRELKVLCTSFNNCDCLVELEGAFLDREEGTVTLVSL